MSKSKLGKWMLTIFWLSKIEFWISLFLFISDPTGQLGLAGATEAHWAGYNSSYAAASYAAASSFAYSGSAASGAELAGQQSAATLTDQASAASASQIPTGKTHFRVLFLENEILY